MLESLQCPEDADLRRQRCVYGVRVNGPQSIRVLCGRETSPFVRMLSVGVVVCACVSGGIDFLVSVVVESICVLGKFMWKSEYK